MSKLLTSIWSNFMLLGKLIGNERGEVGEHDAGDDAGDDKGKAGGDKGEAGGTDDGDAADAGADAGTDDKSKASAKPDWRVEKYGEDWENSAQYWKDNSTYAWSQYKTEKAKRQKAVPLEEFRADGDKTKIVEGAKPNGATDDVKTEGDIQTVDELLQRVKKENEQFFESKLTERERQANFKNSMQRARKEFVGDPDNGIPSFAEIEQDVLIPLIEKNPRVLALLKEMDGDPAENAYTLGIVVKSRNIDGLRGMFERKGREDFAKKLDDVSKQAVRVKAGRSGSTSTKLAAEDIWNMSSADFEKHVAKQTGHT